MPEPADPAPALERARRLVADGALESAQGLLRELIGRQPRCFEAYELLARLLEASSQLPALTHTLEVLARLKPGDGRIWRWAGDVHARQGSWDGAILAFRRAQRLLPEDPETALHLAMALIGDQRIAEVPLLLDHLLARFPDEARGYLIRGHLEKIQGCAAAAAAAYETALQLDPNLSDAMYNLADTRPPLPHSDVSRAIRRFALRADCAHGEFANAHFALARIAEAAGEVEEAFAQYQRANTAASAAMRSLGVTYERAEEERRVAEVLRRYPGPFAGMDDPREDTPFRPIFIVGMPRSGTTLVEQILAAHSQVAAGGELTYLPECAALFDRLLAGRAPQPLSGNLDVEVRGVLRQLRTCYIDRCFERDLDRPFVVDKLPMNFWWLGLARLMFPQAVVVHCRRDPLATCWSLYRANFDHHLPYYNDFADLAHQYGIYRRLMAHWCEVLEPRIVEVQYERLVREPYEEITALLQVCELDAEPACFEPHALPRPIFTASQLQARRPINASAGADWRAFATQLEPLRKLLCSEPRRS